MFVRFRQTKRGLQVSLIETRREGCKVRHEHIAALGSVRLPLTVPDRIRFWAGLHERMVRLSNRLDGSQQTKVLGEVHARVPMVTPDEQRIVQRETAEADARLWATIEENSSEHAAGHKDLISKAEKARNEAEAAAADAGARAADARQRIERIDRGEDVDGGLTGPIDIEKMLRDMGFTKSDLDHMRTVAEIEHFGEAAFERLIEMHCDDSQQRDKVLARRLLRQLRNGARAR